MKRIILAFSMLAAGCATKIAPVYPTHETAIVSTYVNNLGFKGLFASEGTQTVSTRADMRRAEDTFSFSGFVMKHLAKARDSARIWRVDKDLLWNVDLAGKTYTECPLTGCPAPAGKPPAERQPAPEQPQKQKKPECKLTLTKNSFTVKETGAARMLNGFDAKQYKIDWNVVAQDKDKNKDTSAVSVELWTTREDDPRIKAVRAVEHRFESALNARRPEESGMGRVVPAEALKIINMQFVNNFSADTRSSLLAAGKELSKVHGFPVSTTLNWYLDGNACQAAAAPQEKQASTGYDLTHGLSGLLGSAAQKGAENQANGMAGKPVFGFVQEVKEMKVDQASDGLFVPPPDFKLVKR